MKTVWEIEAVPRKPSTRDPKSILNPAFRYVDSASTDIRKTFARIRREQERAWNPKVRDDPYIQALLAEGMTLHKG